MKKEVLFVLLLGIIHSILFVEFSLGINVFLFTICLLSFFYYYFQKKGFIHNRWGLFFMIPILILSSNYFVHHNLFHILNVLAIPVLYVLLFFYTIKPIDSLDGLFFKMLHILIKPLDYIGKVWKSFFDSFAQMSKMNNRNQQLIVSILIIIPILFIVLSLLSSADMVFHNMFGSVFDFFSHFTFGTFLERVFRFVLFTTYLGCWLVYISGDYLDEKEKSLSQFSNPYTMKLLLTSLNIIYLVFDVIQIRSLIFHMGLEHLNYAEYARSGFFQLMFISMINIIILLLCKRFQETKYNQWMSVGMIFLTLIIICSSFLRMYLYEQAYGYTVLRLGVYAILITEAILLIPTIYSIFHQKFALAPTYLIILVSVYSLINCFSVDRIITSNNIKRYYRVNDIDLEYLENEYYDNIPQLRSFLEELPESEEKTQLRIYIARMDKRNETKLFEFNISKRIAKKRKS